MQVLNEQQAYVATYHFLKGFYERTQAEEIAWLLGSMSLLEDGSTADPAITHDWKSAVIFALDGGNVDPLVLAPS